MRVSRSLTIKQMAMVSIVAMVFIFLFCVILLFHFVQQNRYNTGTQMESIARSVREPLSAAILKGDIADAEAILKRIQPAGVVSRADVVLPQPRGPEKRYAWLTRSVRRAVRSGSVTCDWPISSAHVSAR